MGLTRLITEVIEERAKVAQWPTAYVNSETNKTFREPKDRKVRHYLYSDEPTYVLFRAPEGSGKTAMGTIKALNKLRRGLSGALICPDFPYMTRIITEVWRWIPWDCVIDRYQHYAAPGWKPNSSSFEIKFHNELGTISTLLIGGVSDNYVKFESLNLNFVWIEEARAIKSPTIMDVLSGRIRINGPKGEPPQLYITSTPTSTSHWLYKYFGPPLDEEEDDPFRAFKEDADEVLLSLQENMENLNESFVETRIKLLSDNQRRMRVEGEWGDDDAENPFLPDMELWRRLNDPNLPAVRTKTDPKRDWSDVMVLALDAGVKHDWFALVGLTRHPDNRNKAAVRLVKAWIPNGKQPLDFRVQEAFIRELVDRYNVVTIVYDPYQLHQMSQNLKDVVWMQEFNQASKRTKADQEFFQAIIEERISHMGQHELDQHIRNADGKFSEDGHTRRLTKRYEGSKIDLAVACSMGYSEVMRLNL